MSDSPHYTPGSESELERLQLQARCLEGLTRRLIRESGIRAGMRVLDLGSGPGDVAFLLAEAVGPSGSVLGVDREERSVDLARRRAAEAGYGNVAFVVAGDDSLPADAPFDAAIGRFVLIHQRDPAAMIRRAAAVVRPGGVVAFLEPALHLDGHSLPEVELVRAAAGSFKRLMLAALPSPDVAGRMIPSFMEAGLPEPKVLWESVVPGSTDDVWLRSFVLTYKTLLPVMQKFGTVDPRVGDPETLAERVMAEARAKRAQSVTGPFASAWAIKG
jgi:ubiquinone/menaquinone biosynthesis C-methylase UbiE